MTFLFPDRWKALTVDQNEAESIASVLTNLEKDFKKAAAELDRFTGLAVVFRAEDTAR